MTPTATIRREAITARRDAHGWTSKQLATELGVHPATVFRVLAGRTTPGPAFANAYARRFGNDALADLYGTPTEVAA